MDFEIKKITVDYIEGFRQAAGTVLREKKYLAFLDAPSFEMAREFVQNYIKEKSPHVIAIADCKVIGLCDIVGLNRPVCQHDGSLGIVGIGVIKECRGSGIGKLLLKEALSLAFKKGLERMELTVREDNSRAIELYKKFGFVTEGVHQKSVLIDGSYYNQVFMALFIDKAKPD